MKMSDIYSVTDIAELRALSCEYCVDIERDNKGNEYIEFADGSKLGFTLDYTPYKE